MPYSKWFYTLYYIYARKPFVKTRQTLTLLSQNQGTQALHT